MQLLAQSRPTTLEESALKAAVAVSLRRQVWGVDGVWSYDFSKLGYACESSCGGGGASVGRQCVLRASFERALHAGKATFRVLDLGAGSGGWLLQARKELEVCLREKRATAPEGTSALGSAECGGRREAARGSTVARRQQKRSSHRASMRSAARELRARPTPAIHLHGVTGGADSFVGRPVLADGAFEVAHFQQVGFELCPPRRGEATEPEEQQGQFAQAVGAAIASGGGESSAKTVYDLIVSSWTFCHLSDQLGTLEMWSNSLAVDGELFLNDIDFWVLFDSECARGAVSPLPQRVHEKGDGDIAQDDSAIFWKSDTEWRMERTFEILNAKGIQDGTFSLVFVTDEDYRTAVKVKRLSSEPIRFSPVVGYSADDNELPMYCISDVF